MLFVGILAKASPQRWQIKRTLEANARVQVEEFSHVDELMTAIKSRRLSVVLLKVEVFKESHIETLRKLKLKLPNTPIMMLASAIPDRLRTQFANLELPQVAIADSRFELGDLSYMLMKLNSGEGSAFRRHRRFETFERATVSFRTGAVNRAMVLNLSASGACIKAHRPDLVVGSQVAIKVLEGTPRFFVIEGEVAWTSDKHHQIGVHFKRINVNRYLQLVH